MPCAKRFEIELPFQTAAPNVGSFWRRAKTCCDLGRGFMWAMMMSTACLAQPEARAVKTTQPFRTVGTVVEKKRAVVYPVLTGVLH